VIGVGDELKGQVPRALVVLKGDRQESEDLRSELMLRVRTEVGPIASLQRVDVVPALPKTRSGKILRRTMREIVDGKHPAVPSTIEDATVLDVLAPVLIGPPDGRTPEATGPTAGDSTPSRSS
jgi:propionyl-CoA synthetase